MGSLSNLWLFKDYIRFRCFNKFGKQQYAQYDAVRMEDENRSRISGVEDGHHLVFRIDHPNGKGRPIISTSELTPPGYHAIAVHEEREPVRIPRRRSRFPSTRSRWKGGVSFSSPVPNSKIMDEEI